MAEDSTKTQKNRAFLAEFLSEGIYSVAGDEEMEAQKTESTEAEKVVESQEFEEQENPANLELAEAKEYGNEDSSPTEVNEPKASEPEVTENPSSEAFDSAESDVENTPYEGQNLSGVLILVNQQSEHNILPKEKLILERILKAIGLSMDDVAIVNLEKTGHDIDRLTSILEVRKILAFGIPQTDFPVTVQPMKPEEWNSIHLLPAPSLEEIALSKESKKQLWHNLKTMFEL